MVFTARFPVRPEFKCTARRREAVDEVRRIKIRLAVDPTIALQRRGIWITGTLQRFFDNLPGGHGETAVLCTEPLGKLANNVMVLARLRIRLDHLARHLQE